MLQLKIALSPEGFDQEKQEFVEPKTVTLHLEHSLVSLSKWESKWCKSFFSTEQKTYEETVDYIKCMTITQNVNPEVYTHLSRENLQQVNTYIEAPMTATTFSEPKSGKRVGGERVTSELIYYWMIAFGIPSEYQKWHINRLLTLIRICEIKNRPSKKRSRRDVANDYAALNAARRKKLNTKG